MLKKSVAGDCINRQAAIDAIWDGTNMDIYTREVKEILEKLPSVTLAMEDNIKNFFLTLYEDLLLFDLDKQTLTFDCGDLTLRCSITFNLDLKEDKQCKP